MTRVQNDVDVDRRPSSLVVVTNVLLSSATVLTAAFVDWSSFAVRLRGVRHPRVIREIVYCIFECVLCDYIFVLIWCGLFWCFGTVTLYYPRHNDELVVTVFPCSSSSL